MMATNDPPESNFLRSPSRRRWLQLGGAALGGLSLPQILAAESQSAGRNSAKGVILVLLPGGPSHLDLYDLKPDAPPEIRGEFQPIATRTPGVEICELLPRLAGISDKLTFVRSLHGFRDDHNTHWCSTGWESHPEMDSSPLVPGFPPGDWPSFGSILSHQFGPRARGVPPAIDLTPIDKDARFILRTPPCQPGCLGSAHAGFEVQAVDRRNISMNGVTLDQLDSRQALLASFDRFRRQVDATGIADGLDEFHRQAMEVLTSNRLAEALDLSKEDAATLRRYGLDKDYSQERDGKTLLDQFLLARRAIEAGARCVTLAFSRWPFGRMLKGDFNWDWHRDCFKEARGTLPLLDLGLSALIEDLEERGLLDDVGVVAWGEFGRTPRINENAGRDHWPRVGGALVAGAGMKSGQVIGSSTRWGEEPLHRPVHFREIFATLYERLGIDVETTQFTDLAGRPHYLVGEHRAMDELV